MRQITSSNGGHHLLLLLLLLIVLVLSVHTPATVASARLQRHAPNLGGSKMTRGLQAVDDLPEEEEEGSWKLPGVMEECEEEGKEECEKRRMTYEAHLDYIYTQHRPKP